MDRARLIDFFLQKLNDKDFQISEIRLEMEKYNLPEEEIRTVVRIIDNEIQRRDLLRLENSKARNLTWVGVVLTGIGAFVTIATYVGLIDMGDQFLLTYGPFLGGLSILFSGLARQRRR